MYLHLYVYGYIYEAKVMHYRRTWYFLGSQFTLCSRKKISDYYATTQLANHIPFYNSCVHIYYIIFTISYDKCQKGVLQQWDRVLCQKDVEKKFFLPFNSKSFQTSRSGGKNFGIVIKQPQTKFPTINVSATDFDIENKKIFIQKIFGFKNIDCEK